MSSKPCPGMARCVMKTCLLIENLRRLGTIMVLDATGQLCSRQKAKIQLELSNGQIKTFNNCTGCRCLYGLGLTKEGPYIPSIHQCKLMDPKKGQRPKRDAENQDLKS